LVGDSTTTTSMRGDDLPKLLLARALGG